MSLAIMEEVKRLRAENEQLRGELAALKAEGRGEDYLRIEWLSHENDGLKAQLAAQKKRLEKAPVAIIYENGRQTQGLKKAVRHFQEIAKQTGESCEVSLVRKGE